MAITVEYLTGLGIEKDVAEKIFKERGKEIASNQATQETVESLKKQLKEAKETITTMTTELDGLKESNASAEDWQKKYEDFKKEVDEKEQAAKEQAAAAEKEANLQARFKAAAVDKNGQALPWNEDYIEQHYMDEFFLALEKPENQGRADKDVLFDLYKNDNTAIKGVQRVVLEGAKPIGTLNNMTKDEIMSIKDTATRQQAIADNKELFNI